MTTAPPTVADELRLAFTTYAGKQKPAGRPQEMPWGQLRLRLQQHQVRRRKDGELWSPVLLVPEHCTRKNEHVQAVCALVMDHDDGALVEAVLAPFREECVECILYSTHSHTPEFPKTRTVSPFTRPVLPSEYALVWRGAVALFGRGHVDLQCSDISRSYYFPTTIPKSERDWEPVFIHQAGRLLDPDELKQYAPPAPEPRPRTTTAALPSSGDRVPADKILASCQERTRGKARHYRGYHLAEQLRDNGYSQAEAESVVLQFQRDLEDDGDHKYTEAEALASMREAYKKPGREPWVDQETRSSDTSSRTGAALSTNGKHPAPEPLSVNGRPAPMEPGPTLNEVLDAFRHRLYLPDDGHLKLAFGTYMANQLSGPPVWLMEIGGPGSGKTEATVSMDGLPHVRLEGSLSGPAALLSGTTRKERSPNASGGILREIGAHGILLLKDFTSTLTMKPEARAELLAALREVYDGHWRRSLGVDGGTTLQWSGKLGVIACCTPSIDTHHAVISGMGERFILCRLPMLSDEESDEQAEKAIDQAEDQAALQRELNQIVRRFFASLPVPEEWSPLAPEEKNRLRDLATLAVRCRSAVERDGRTREIVLVPDPENPTRFAKVLAVLFQGMLGIGVDREEAWRLIARVCLDSAPALRRRAFLHAAQAGTTTTSDFALALSHPTGVVRFALQELHAHRLLDRTISRGQSDQWSLTAWAREKYTRVAPYLTGDLLRKNPRGGMETEGEGEGMGVLLSPS